MRPAYVSHRPILYVGPRAVIYYRRYVDVIIGYCYSYQDPFSGFMTQT
jgi:hypothetical protein